MKFFIYASSLKKTADNRYILPQTVNRSGNNTKWQIRKVYIPATFDTISSERENNKLYFTLQTFPDIKQVMTIPNGSYTLLEFKTAFETYIKQIDANFVVSYSVGAKTFNIENNTTAFKLHFGDSKNFGGIVGFPVTGSSSAYINTYTSPYSFNITDLQCIKLHVENLAQNELYQSIECVPDITDIIYVNQYVTHENIIYEAKEPQLFNISNNGLGNTALYFSFNNEAKPINFRGGSFIIELITTE